MDRIGVRKTAKVGAGRKSIFEDFLCIGIQLKSDHQVEPNKVPSFALILLIFIHKACFIASFVYFSTFKNN